MAITFNESSVPAEPLATGVARQRLMDEWQLPRARIVLDRLALAAGSTMEIGVSARNAAWFQVLEGACNLRHESGMEQVTEAHIACLPPGFRGAALSANGAVLLYAEVPDASQFDPDFGKQPQQVQVVDWTREPVLDSPDDARRRIHIVTPGLSGTRAIKGEIIICPPKTKTWSQHHEGAENFMYVLHGLGAAYANELPIPLRAGDLVYFGDGERQYLRNDGLEDMIFVEFFVPGVYKTVWAEGAPVCTWQPSGRDIRGGKPARDIEAHSSAVTPENV